MANLYRLILVLLFCTWANDGHAAGTWSYHAAVGCTNPQRVDMDSATAADILAAYIIRANQTCSGRTYAASSCNETTGTCTYTCNINAGANCGQSSYSITWTPTPCPSGQSREPLANNVCMPTCPAGQKRSISAAFEFQGCYSDSANPLDAKCSNNKGVVENYYSTPSPAATNTVCASLGANAGCAITVTYTASATTNGIKTLYGTGVVSGKTCTQAAADNAAASPPLLPPIDADKAGAPAPTPCKPGTAPGTVNGVTSCYPMGASTPVDQTATTTTTNADGSKTTTTKTTSCDAANCSTTTTSTTVPAAGGAGTTTTSSDQKPKESFCQENPQATVCKSGSFSGSCSVGFSCDGDALQCSIAREQYTRNCQMFDKSTPESTLYDTEKVKTGDQTTALPGNRAVTLSGSSFSQTPIFVAQGLSDLNITVAGKAQTIELTKLNSWLEILGYIAVSVTALVCFRVVFGGTA